MAPLDMGSVIHGSVANGQVEPIRWLSPPNGVGMCPSRGISACKGRNFVR